MEGELKSLIKVWLSVIASLCYCYFISSKIPKGKLRFLSLSPIFYLFTILPLSLSTVLPTGITAFFITWLTNFKLLLFSFDLGPLSSHPPKSLPLFIFIACFPIKIKQEKTYPSYQKPLNPKNPQNPSFDLQKNPKLHLNLPTKAFLFVLLVMGINEHKQNLHPKAVMGIYCCLLYLLVDTVMGLCNNLVQATIGGIELELPSDEPYCSTSLQDFWGRRWNLMVSNILRDTVPRGR
ncbi:acyl-CoA--sterol O-acyltransferase 1-like [Quillaja saponaria]|uniref:Acyl-CoA--sterol O-acyltransferase 1-like n=1 Tax=Quillaja saponaria TaxID=32244 RepID=A0AAD7LMQ0_QUISA|nr:acyl-CoA--sterol O-acyltransferase 1-like [Quillaja saponaria]